MSVRTSSSHRSTIETRGAPEFDRDYARQLSTAKRGRSGSVKASPRAGSAQESPLEESGIGHFSGAAAAAAATRIKDYVTTHVTPPRPLQLGTPRRANDGVGSASHGPNNSGASSPISTRPHSGAAAKGGNASNTLCFGAASPAANEGGAAGETNSPPNADSLSSTRCGSTTAPPDAGTGEKRHESVWVTVLTTVVLCVVVLFVLLCTLSLLVSSDKDYIPTYFNRGGRSQEDAAAGAARRSFADRIVPQLSRQIALRMRRMLGQMMNMLGVLKVMRLCSGMLRYPSKLFTMLWTVVKEGIISPVAMMLPKVDVSIHPTLRYVFSGTAEGAEGWTISKGSAVVGSLIRSLLQLIIEPMLVIWRIVHAVGRGFSQSVQLFSVPLVGQNTTMASPLYHNATPPVKAVHRGNRTSIMSRATSSLLLTMWRPLHRLWGLMAPLTTDNVAPSPKKNGMSSLLNHTSSFNQTFTKERAKPAAGQPVARNNSGTGTKGTTTQAATVAKHVPPKVRTTHTHRVEGELWATLLEQHTDQLTQLARDDVQELMGSAVVVESLRLRPGSLVIDFTVVAPGVAGVGEEAVKQSGVGLQQATQWWRDAQVSKGRFSRLLAFYEDEGAKRKQASDSAAAAAASTKCDERVVACRQECDGVHQKLQGDLHACKEASVAAQKMCEAMQASTLQKADVELQACREQGKACEARAFDCATNLSEVEKLLEERDAERQDSIVALAAATAGYANQSEAEKQRCVVKVAEAAHNCTKRVEEVRAALVAEHASDMEAKRKACELEALRVGELSCTSRLTQRETALKEECRASVQHTEARCAERLTEKVGEMNRSSLAALHELQHTLNASAADAAQRLAACEASSKKAMERCTTEQKKHDANFAAQLVEAQTACQEAERRAAAEECGRRLGMQREELQVSCNAAVLQVEETFKSRLSHDVAAFNSTAVATLAQLQNELEAVKRIGEERVAACDALRATQQETCAAAQRRTNESCAVQLQTAEERCAVALHERLEAERVAQQQLAQDNWTHQAALLATRCSHDTQHAVEQAAAELKAQHAQSLQETTKNLQRHTEELHSCEERIANCVSEGRAARAAHAKDAAEARTQLFAYLADSGETACLRVTNNDKSGCAAERKKIEATLDTLPTTATLLEALSGLGVAPSSSVHLAWNFSGSGLHSLHTDVHRAKRPTPWLHVAGTLVGFASAAFALFRRRQDRRVYKDTITQLNALIAANETSMALRPPLAPRPRCGRLGAAAAAFADDAPVSWTVTASCVANCTDALVSWHSTCCAMLFEQALGALLKQRYDAQRSLLSDVSSHAPSDTTALSLSRGAVPPTSIVSGSTLLLSDVDTSQADSMRALTHMHEAFVNTYYNVLEMYYVDLLNAVANRELAESQLQEAESIASRQATLLHKQSAAVAQLKRVLAEKEKELAHRAVTAASGSASSAAGGGAEDKLVREERKTAAQQAMIALLEEQLKVSKEELDRARESVHTPGWTPRSETGAESSTAKQVRSLQELADAKNDSTNSSDFSNAACSPRRATAAPLSEGDHAGTLTSRGVPAETQRVAPASALKKPASMMRDPESTRRYHKLRWNDESGAD
jgi:hypothetical protein